MKLIKTLKIKLGKLSKNKQNILDILLRKNTKAINFCLQKGKKEQITHTLVYQDLRKMNLPATVICGCRAKSVEILKSYITKRKKKKIKFPIFKNSSVRFDNQVVKLRKTNNKLYKHFVSLLYKAGISGKSDNRIELPLILNSDFQNNIIKQIGNNYKLGSTELLKRKDNYFVHISYSKEVNLPVPDESFSPIGIDIGINNLAVSVAQSGVKFHSGQRVAFKNEFFRKQRAKLKRNFAMKEIKRLRGRQTRYNDFYLHNIAKSIVEQAKKEIKPVIVMEDLTYIQETTKVTKSKRARYRDWVFNRLQKAIEYKSNWEEIPVIYIEPHYSSQICPKCGELNKRVRHTYKCKYCDYEANADYIAGRNLQKIFLAKCQGEHASINYASSYIYQKPKAMRDNAVRNLQRGRNLW